MLRKIRIERTNPLPCNTLRRQQPCAAARPTRALVVLHKSPAFSLFCWRGFVERRRQRLTPKELNNTAQGAGRRERTLGTNRPHDHDPERVVHGRDVTKKRRLAGPAPSVKPLQGLPVIGPVTQGALPALATLGYVVNPLRGKAYDPPDAITAKRGLMKRARLV